MSQYDIFVNIVGGLTLKEPAMDLPVIAAICSSVKNISVPQNTVIIGEVGLTGETRSVMRIEQRVSEAVRMGFDKVLLPASAKKKIPAGEGNIRFIKNIQELPEKMI
ncbi:MAG: magnesium chelatase domain-containing protein [Candidatus Marinimicrobia bacterium]|nr:magnesium chelatase domain-containing protein [Candidatus Neomarinimicrobiota bacterium]